jgi:hypothetical protein
MQSLLCFTFIIGMLTAQTPSAQPPSHSDPVLIPIDMAMQHLLRLVPPKPLASRPASLGINQPVKLHFTIDSQGVVQNITVKKGDPLLIPSATDALREWRFTPFSKPVQTDIEMEFTRNLSPEEMKRNDLFQKTYFPAINAARAALDRVDIVEADKQSGLALSALNAAPQVSWRHRAMTWGVLAQVRTMQKNFLEGERLFNDALAIQYAHDEQNQDIASLLGDLGLNLLSQNRFAEGTLNLAKSIDIYKKLIESADDDVMRELKPFYRMKLASYSGIMARYSSTPEGTKAACTDAMLNVSAVTDTRVRQWIEQACSASKQPQASRPPVR